MANKLQSLIDVFKSSPKVFYDRPPEKTSDDITNELELRERTDQMLAVARMRCIQNLFSNEPKNLNPFL